MSTVDHAIDLWTNLDHPKSFSNARNMSDSLTRIFFGMSLNERAEYTERTWKLVQKKLRKQKAERIKSMLPGIFRLHNNGEYRRANDVFDALIKLVT